jgi:flagellar biosynthesis anti-sigma factor FlgM
MRIDLNSIHGDAPDPGTVKAGSIASVAPASSGLAANAQDSVSLDHSSLDQGRAQALATQVLQLPEVRTEKVAALQLAIRSGTYRVTAQSTANAILSEIEARPAA